MLPEDLLRRKPAAIFLARTRSTIASYLSQVFTVCSVRWMVPSARSTSISVSSVRKSPSTSPFFPQMRIGLSRFSSARRVGQCQVGISRDRFAGKVPRQHRAAVVACKLHRAFQFIAVRNITACHIQEPRTIRRDSIRISKADRTTPKTSSSVRLAFFEQRVKLLPVSRPPPARIETSKPRQRFRRLHACLNLFKPVRTIWFKPASCSSRCRRPSAVSV